MADQVDLGIEGLSDFTAIGSGGFSTVYAAWDETFSRRVAVKLLHSLDEDGRRRFDRERNILGRLSDHPNVVTPFRFGYTEERVAYLVMEHMDGGSLQDLLDREASLDWVAAIDYVLPISEALGHGHRHGVLHRDVKPANVLLSETGVPKLADYGIASLREATTTQMAYTLAHSPPETFADGFDRRDERSDLYSLASSLYTLIVGRSPYEIDGHDYAPAFMRRIEQHPVPDVGAGPPELGDILARTLAKDPADRPSTAAELTEGLRAVRAGAGRAAPGVAATTIGPSPAVDSGPGAEGLARQTALADGPPGAADRTGDAPPVDVMPPQRPSSMARRLLAGVCAAVLVAGVIGVVLWRTTGDDGGGGDEALSASETTPLAPSSTTIDTDPPQTTTDTGPPVTTASSEPTAAIESAAVGEVTVGLLYDVEGWFEGGPNERAAAGLEQAVEEFGVEVTEATPDPSGSDREDLLREMAESSDLVIAGVESADALLQVAEEHPEVHFALIGSDVSFGRSNVMALVFEIHEGSYLVGAAAALQSETGKIGFLGPVHEFWWDDFFRAPFEAGARAVDPAIEVEARYISETPDASAYDDAASAERIGREMYDGGVDVIYDLTGASAPGLFRAADASSDELGTKVWAIGAWNDGYRTAGPGLQDHVLTSMVMREDVAVLSVIRSEVRGSFAGGYVLHGLLIDGVDYSTSGGFVDGFVAELDELKQQIVAGDIDVPTKFEEGSSADG